MLTKTTGVKENENITRKTGKFTKGRIDKKNYFPVEIQAAEL